MLARLMRLWLLFELCACLGLGLVWHALLAWSWGRVFLSLVLLALLLRLLVVLTTQWLAVWLNPQTRLLTRYPLALWLRSLAQEWLAFSVIQASMSWPQFMPRRDCNRPREPGQQVLLLVHGYGCNRGFWWWLKPRLEARGLQVATLTLEPLLGSISGYTEQLAQRVNRLCQETGAARVWLVGHSMGGLACLAYLARYGEARVQGLITLGSPHGGTHMARLGPGRNCEEMRPGSLWLRQLADDFALLPLRVPLIAAWSPLVIASRHGVPVMSPSATPIPAMRAPCWAGRQAWAWTPCAAIPGAGSSGWRGKDQTPELLRTGGVDYASCLSCQPRSR